MSNYAKPEALKEGSIIGIAAASSTFSEEKFGQGVEVLKSLGFEVRHSQDITKRKSGYLAGPDEVRAAELSALLSDPEIDAVMFARGGYGIQRIMPNLDFSAFKLDPKTVIGFSDLTTLTSYITSHLNTTCLYGPVVTALADNNEVTISSLKMALTSNSPLDPIKSGSLRVIKEGEAGGKLLGGCLSLLSTSVGTPYELRPKGSVLFLEDFNEKIYEYDRMLVHLRNAGLFEGVSGIIFGSVGLAEGEEPDQLWRMVSETFHDFRGPIVAGFGAGHTTPFLTLPLGVECRLVSKKKGSGEQGVGLFFEEAALI